MNYFKKYIQEKIQQRIKINKKAREYLISNLDKSEFCQEELKGIYEKRQQIEMPYNRIKKCN